MSVVTAQMVKEIRELTGAGMSDCKKALDEAQGNLDKAIIVLREKGLAAAAKKAARAASEGAVCALASEDKKSGFVFEVNCETDFVTRNDAFTNLMENLKTLVIQKAPKSLEALLSLPLEGGTVQDTITAMIAKIGENIQIRRFETLSLPETLVTSYTHGAGKVGVIVALAGENISAHASSTELQDLGKDIALQIAAMKPQFLTAGDVPSENIAAEESVIRGKFLKQGKPEAAIAKIVPSAIQSWMKEICLLDQIFVKDESKNINQHIVAVGNALGIKNLKVVQFVSLELGQGVEKKQDDFAAEVAAQVASALKN